MALIGLPQREPVEAIKRKPLTAKEKVIVFQAAKGICYLCKTKILGKWRDEHELALHLGGSNDLSNRKPVHYECAKIKDKKDAKLIAKGRRLRGETGKSAKKKKIPSRPMPGTIASGIKRDFKGRVSKR